MDLLLTLGLKIVAELELSFVGFVDKEASDENELRERILLKIFGLSFGLKNSLRLHFVSETCPNFLCTLYQNFQSVILA